MINQQIQGKVTGQHAWVIQLMSEPKFSPRLRDLAYDYGQGNSIKNTEHVWFVHAA